MSVPRKFFCRIALLLAVCALLSGCVYLRLLELKHQLADFDHNVTLDESDGLTLTLQKPVLLIEDMAFFELAPESQTALGVALRWHLRWIKDYAAPGERPADYEVAADFTFVEGKLQRAHLPEKVFAFVPKSLVVAALRSLGHANLDKTKKSAQATLGPADSAKLTQADLRRFLGAPIDTHRIDNHIVVHYRYTGVSPLQTAGKIDLVFTLDAATKTVVHLQGRLAHVIMELDWPNAGAAEAKPAP